MTDKERRTAVNRALQDMGNRNRVTITAGMSRQEANAALHRAAAGEMPAPDAHAAEPDTVAFDLNRAIRATLQGCDQTGDDAA